MNSPPQPFRIPELPGRAPEVVRRVEKNWNEMTRQAREGYEVALYVATPFGTHRLVTLFSQGEHLLLMNIETGGEFSDILYCPVEQAAFLFQHFRPTEEKEKILIGFGVHHPDGH